VFLKNIPHGFERVDGVFTGKIGLFYGLAKVGDNL
jgi:hypothetical protein